MTNNPPTSTMKLVDRFNRHVNYVRLSVTDRCDLRCVYCMNEKMQFMPRNQLLSLEEIYTVAKGFTDLGVDKIRITGGEPLTRKNIMWLFEHLGSLTSLKDLTLTTNGTQLSRYAQGLKDNGVTRINISLDTLQPERFAQMTRFDRFHETMNGIDAALKAGFKRLKLNTVIMKDRNNDEINELVQFAIDRDMDISFIEEMPLGVINEHGREEVFYSSDQVREDIEKQFELIGTTEKTAGPSRYFRIAGTHSRVGFISPHSHNFCDSCNRVRVTAEGRLLLCLGQEHSVDLREILREYPGDEQQLHQALLDAMHIKPKGHEFSLTEQPIILRHMNTTGG